jgi:hypothetical protein
MVLATGSTPNCSVGESAGGHREPQGPGQGQHVTGLQNCSTWRPDTQEGQQQSCEATPVWTTPPWSISRWHVVIICPLSKVMLSPNLIWWSESQQLKGRFNFITCTRPPGPHRVSRPQTKLPPVLRTLSDPRDWCTGITGQDVVNGKGTPKTEL